MYTAVQSDDAQYSSSSAVPWYSSRVYHGSVSDGETAADAVSCQGALDYTAVRLAAVGSGSAAPLVN